MTFKEFKNYVKAGKGIALLKYEKENILHKKEIRIPHADDPVIKAPKGSKSNHMITNGGPHQKIEYIIEGYYIERNVDNHFFELTFATYDPATGILSDLQDSGDFGGTILECKLKMQNKH